MLSRRHVLIALVGVVAAVAPAAAAPPRPTSVTIAPGAVVSLATGTLYVMDPTAGIVAVDVKTGKARWAARTRAAKPLAQVGRALIGVDEQGVVRVLDARTGKLRTKCATIPGLTLPIMDGLGSQHSSAGSSDGRRAWITSSSSSHYAGGAAPTPEQEAAARTQSGGVHEVDLTTCAVTAGVDPFAPTNGSTPGAIVYATPTGMTIGITAGAPRLERTRGATALPTIDLQEGNAARTIAAVTADRRHVIVAEFAGNAYPAAIFDVESGAVVARVTLPFFPYGSVLLGRRLVMGGGAVFAFDLDRQQVQWTRAVRATAYSGPYPPSAAP